jgi:hypothetical protein
MDTNGLRKIRAGSARRRNNFHKTQEVFGTNLARGYQVQTGGSIREAAIRQRN